ncbi:Uncharacterised protein [Mannheimia haemolytica]|uniref:Uncharacterized protein n=1 Tax=Mannheimia haemolytica TaxID=75985 RepID=A0A378MYQ7_MANHA|nr:Uncharacterised protein [Mannheimia haemolytica]
MKTLFKKSVFGLALFGLANVALADAQSVADYNAVWNK